MGELPREIDCGMASGERLIRVTERPSCPSTIAVAGYSRILWGPVKRKKATLVGAVGRNAPLAMLAGEGQFSQIVKRLAEGKMSECRERRTAILPDQPVKLLSDLVSPLRLS